jgi:hypothetical protein
MGAEGDFDEIDELHALIESFEPGAVKAQFHALINSLSEQQLHDLLVRMRRKRRRLMEHGEFVV